MRAPIKAQYGSFTEAVAEAIRLNDLCTIKFGEPRSDWVYRVRKRRSGITGHWFWYVFVPYFEALPGTHRIPKVWVR